MNVLSRWTERLTPSKQSVLIVVGIIKHIFSKSNYLVSKPGEETFVVVIVKYSFWDEDLLDIMAVD